MRYQLLSAYTPHSLEVLVNGLLSEGWRLYGNPFADEASFYQAVTYGE